MYFCGRKTGHDTLIKIFTVNNYKAGFAMAMMIFQCHLARVVYQGFSYLPVGGVRAFTSGHERLGIFLLDGSNSIGLHISVVSTVKEIFFFY